MSSESRGGMNEMGTQNALISERRGLLFPRQVVSEGSSFPCCLTPREAEFHAVEVGAGWEGCQGQGFHAAALHLLPDLAQDVLC